jgi:hypothetical protein
MNCPACHKEVSTPFCGERGAWMPDADDCATEDVEKGAAALRLAYLRGGGREDNPHPVAFVYEEECYKHPWRCAYDQHLHLAKAERDKAVAEATAGLSADNSRLVAEKLTDRDEVGRMQVAA